MTNLGVTSQGPPTIFLDGELDMATVPALEDAIGDAVADGGPITLDLSRMTFIDSGGVGAIVKASRALPSGCINLHGVQEATRKLFDIMGIGKLSNVHVIPCSVLVPLAER